MSGGRTIAIKDIKQGKTARESQLHPRASDSNAEGATVAPEHKMSEEGARVSIRSEYVKCE